MFIKNGVRNALRSLGHDASDAEEAAWVYDVIINRDLRRVEMWVEFPDGADMCPRNLSIA